jgi:nicotinamidase-related amidase
MDGEVRILIRHRREPENIVEDGMNREQLGLTRRALIRTTALAGAAVTMTGLTSAAETAAHTTDPEIAANARKSVLVTIDTQNDFSLPGAPSEIKGTYEVVPNMRRLLETYRTEQLPIVHMIRLYFADGSNVDRSRRSLLRSGARIVLPGTAGAELVTELMPNDALRLDTELLLRGEAQQIGAAEWIRFKPRWGAFFGTDLESQLRNLGVDTAVVTGCNYPNCPRTTLYEASERDFRLALVTDALSGLYDKGRQEMTGIGVNLMTTDEAVDWVRRSA